MRGGRVRAAAIALLVLTLGVLAVAATAGSSTPGGGVPVAEMSDLQDGPRIVVVGVPGWSWSDIDETTPTLQEVEATGASGSLVVRGTYPVTCPVDGWLTLGAGQRAATDETDTAARCAADPLDLLYTSGVNATFLRFRDWQAAAQDQALAAELGLLHRGLADRDQCVSAYGPAAALGAADGRGVVRRYDPAPLADLEEASDPPGSARCRVILIDGSGMDDPGLDNGVTQLIESLPDETLLVVAGLSDAGEVPALHPLLMTRVDSGAPGAVTAEGPARLWSASARQPGLVQTTDLTTSILLSSGAMDDDVADATSGAVITATRASGEAGTDLGPANRDLAAAATLSTRVLPGYAATMGILLAAALLATGLWVRFATFEASRRVAGAALSVTGSALMAFPVSAFAASTLPWWRFGADPATTDPAAVGLGQPTFALVLVTLLIGALLVGGAWAVHLYLVPHPLIPIAIIAAVTMLVIGVDVIRGGSLGLVSVLGVQPVAAGRFYGMGNIAFGIFSAAAIILAGCVASMLQQSRGSRRWWGVLAVLSIGMTAAAIDGWPEWGADFGGVPATLVGTGLLAMAAAGRVVKPSVVFLLVIIAAAVGGVVMVADWLRPADERSHLGNFVQAVLDGGAWDIVTRKLDQSLGILLDYPASWLAVAALGAAVYAVFARRSRLSRSLRPVWDQPLMHACAGALVAVWLLGWVLNDSGISVVALGLTVAVGAAVCVAAQGRSTRLGTGALGGAGSASPSR
ncbi:MAG: hypothetical protein WBA72_04920 [Ornithinimicrobium sp.]